MSRNRDSFWLNISIPINKQQVSSYYRSSDGYSIAGVRTSNTLTENSTWSLNAEHDLKDNKNNNLSGNINTNLHYTSLGVFGSASNNNQQNVSAILSGGVVAHKEGVIFSPYSVDDTFGVISLDPPISGVELNTPKGKVWTDWRGKAVASSVPAYKNSKIELNTEKLPLDIDITNGYRGINVGHGTVFNTRFPVIQTRNILFNATLVDGEPLPKGSSIMTSDGHYVTTVIEDGIFFVNHIDEYSTLVAKWQESACEMSYSLPKKSDKNNVYEQVTTLCR